MSLELKIIIVNKSSYSGIRSVILDLYKSNKLDDLFSVFRKD